MTRDDRKKRFMKTSENQDKEEFSTEDFAEYLNNLHNDSETESETKPETEPESEVETKTETESENETESESETEPESEVETESETIIDMNDYEERETSRLENLKNLLVTHKKKIFVIIALIIIIGILFSCNLPDRKNNVDYKNNTPITGVVSNSNASTSYVTKEEYQALVERFSALEVKYQELEQKVDELEERIEQCCANNNVCATNTSSNSNLERTSNLSSNSSSGSGSTSNSSSNSDSGTSDNSNSDTTQPEQPEQPVTPPEEEAVLQNINVTLKNVDNVTEINEEEFFSLGIKATAKYADGSEKDYPVTSDLLTGLAEKFTVANPNAGKDSEGFTLVKLYADKDSAGEYDIYVKAGAIENTVNNDESNHITVKVNKVEDPKEDLTITSIVPKLSSETFEVNMLGKIYGSYTITYSDGTTDVKPITKEHLSGIENVISYIGDGGTTEDGTGSIVVQGVKAGEQTVSVKTGAIKESFNGVEYTNDSEASVKVVVTEQGNPLPPDKQNITLNMSGNISSTNATVGDKLQVVISAKDENGNNITIPSDLIIADGNVLAIESINGNNITVNAVSEGSGTITIYAGIFEANGNTYEMDKDVVLTVNVSPQEQEQQPEEPTEPVQPEEPTDPVEPEEPVQPEEPTDPVEPEEPVQPEEPTDPVEPEEPVQPEEPTDPVEPEEPVQPEEPTEPVEPEEPPVQDPTQDYPGASEDDVIFDA